MPDFSFRVFHQDADTLLAVCDFSLLGENFEENGLQLSVSREFYHEKSCEAGRIKNLIKGATIVNAVGRGIVSMLVSENLADKDSILVVQGVPHVQVIKV